MHVLFRTDASTAIGAGHLMRCLALAQHLRDKDVACDLLTTDPTMPLVEAWRHESIPLHQNPAEPGTLDDANLTAATAIRVGAEWIIVDGYCFSTPYQQAIRDSGLSLMCIDDLASLPFDADIVVNQNPGAQYLTHYELHDNGQLLLGADYVMIRRSLRTDEAVGGGGLLVTLGGADRDNTGLAMLKLIVGDFPLRLICTADSEGLAAAQAYADDSDGRVLVQPAGNIDPLMLTADAAICAGGVTALELAYLGVPLVIMTTADNQETGAAALADAGAAIRVHSIPEAAEIANDLMTDAKQRRSMAAAGRGLIDGRGVLRVTHALRTTCPGKRSKQ